MLLVRHARAGDADRWEGDDRLRPLDKHGRKQAKGLVDALADHTIEAIFSSPYLRCVETVEPLAQARGLAVEVREGLGVELQDTDGAALVRSFAGRPVALCGHGGLPLAALGWEEGFSKGAVYVLGPALEVVEVIPPPA